MTKKRDYISPNQIELITPVGRLLSAVDRAREIIEKGIEDPQGEQIKSSGKIIYPPYNFSRLYEYYEENVWHNACCNIKAQVVTGDIEIISPGDEREPDREYQILDEFIRFPNQGGDVDFLDLLERVWIDYESLGNGYLEVTRNMKGEIAEVGHLPAMTIRKAKNRPGYFQVDYQGNAVVYFRKVGDQSDPYSGDAKTEIMHLKNYYARSSYYGIPDVLPVLGAMYVMRGAETFLSKYFDNAAMLGIIITVAGGKLSKDARTDLKNLIEYGMTGVANAHKTALLDSLAAGTSIDVKRIITDFKIYELTKLFELDRGLIIAAHHVPPKLLGISTPGQLGASNDSWGQMKVFDIVEIRPSKRKIANWINRNIVPALGIKNWIVDFGEMDIKTDTEKNEQLWGDVERSIIDVNEAREERGLEPKEDVLDLDKVADELQKIEKSIERIIQ